MEVNELSNKNNYLPNEKLENRLSKQDSPELIMKMIQLLESKYNTKINIINNEDLSNFPELENVDKSSIRAFISEGGIYVNIDKCNIEEPLHEILHLVLETMKSQNPDQYYKLINSIQNHDMFREVSQTYNDINSNMLEETFIKILTGTVRKSIKESGLFTEESFNTSIKTAISELLLLEGPIDKEDSFNLLDSSVASIMEDFGSRLIENPDGLIDKNNAFYMMEVSSEIKKLLENNQLIQKCNGM